MWFLWALGGGAVLYFTGALEALGIVAPKGATAAGPSAAPGTVLVDGLQHLADPASAHEYLKAAMLIPTAEATIFTVVPDSNPTSDLPPGVLAPADMYVATAQNTGAAVLVGVAHGMNGSLAIVPSFDLRIPDACAPGEAWAILDPS